MNPLYEWYEHFNYVWKKNAHDRVRLLLFINFLSVLKKNHKNEDSFKM